MGIEHISVNHNLRSQIWKGQHSALLGDYERQSRELQLDQLRTIVSDDGTVFDEIEFADALFGRTEERSKLRTHFHQIIERFKNVSGEVIAMPASEREGFQMPKLIGRLASVRSGVFGSLEFKIDELNNEEFSGIVTLALSKVVRFENEGPTIYSNQSEPILEYDINLHAKPVNYRDFSGLIQIGSEQIHRSHTFGQYPNQDSIFLDKVAKAREALGEF